jgi:hypothetical protein
MKRFLIKVFLVVIISCVTITIINVFMLLSKDKLSYYSHERNVVLAYERLVSLKDTNKIVIIAGSNGGFSINSGLIEQAFHMPVVNTSTHGGIGVRMQFEIYSDLLREGDIVVFCPEYGTGEKRLYGESTLVRILSTHLPQAYSKLSFAQWLHILKYIGIHYREVYKHRKSKEFDGPYSAKAINEYGDIEWEREHQDTIKCYDIKNLIDGELVSYYKYVHSTTKERGICLLFLPPTLIGSNFEKDAAYINEWAQYLKQNGIPLQSEPSRYAFPDSLYYDTPYHMTSIGADIRTEVMIDDMIRLLK